MGYLEAGRFVASAHRGGAFHPEIHGLENTVAAFRHAVALGYTYLETDVHVSRDGVLIAFHDDVLDRVTDRTGRIADLDLAEIRAARIGGREPVPTLAEVVEACPEALLNIDIKSEAAVAPLAAFVEEHDLWDRVLVGAFSPRRIRRFRRLTGGRVPTAAHPLEILAFRLAPSARVAAALARLVGGDFVAFQVPHHRGPVRVVTRGFVRRAHAVDKVVHVWTVDEPEEMEHLLDLEVDGFFTDRTDLLMEVLRTRGRWQ